MLPQPVARTLVYECPGLDLVARTGPGEIALWLPERYVVLGQVRSGSGARYEGDGILFWSKGAEALLEFEGRSFKGCRLAPHRAPWEDARRRGVDFRAVGNEPPWYLEIRHEAHLLLVTGYGSHRALTPAPDLRESGGVRVYRALDQAHDVLVEVRQQPCVDSMQGERYPATVTVTHNGQIYRGCGRELDYPW
jgi:putative lipoprotein